MPDEYKCIKTIYIFGDSVIERQGRQRIMDFV